MPHLLGTYKPSLLKYERTVSTDYKSIRQNINKFGYQNLETKKDLLLEYKRNQFNQLKL